MLVSHGTRRTGHALAELAAETDAYCVVVGSRGESFWASLGRFFRPSVSRSVLRERVTPVLVIPSELDEDGG
ncbi:universal stress protein [Sporichthya polymorpha]|uniref:universal stress protein n=1 Tax=Sporichthya polymorpha TaxID=35751 RepID=UPI00036D3DD3|nr:universal stress protein [Sporichthya polymorpha]